jgi:hypothetical protein
MTTGCEVAIFSGPNARERAIRYADRQYGKFRRDQPRLVHPDGRRLIWSSPGPTPLMTASASGFGASRIFASLLGNTIDHVTERIAVRDDGPVRGIDQLLGLCPRG